MSNYDSYKDLAFDLQLENEAMRAKLAKRDKEIAELTSEVREKAAMLGIANDKMRVLEGNYAHLLKELREMPSPHAPSIVDEDDYECGNCCAHISDDWSYCPHCGSEIDWDALDDDDEDEGERFLRDEVYEPLREAMRS